MLHNINFIDWQHYQRLQKKRCIWSFLLCFLVLFIGAETGFFLYAQQKMQLLELIKQDHQVLASRFNWLKLQQKKGEATAAKSRELKQIIDSWSGGRWSIYRFIHGLTLCINSSVSVETLVQNGLNIELNGQFSSADKFNQFIHQLGTMVFIDDIAVESVSTKVPVTGIPSLLYLYRIQIRLNGSGHGDNDHGRTDSL